MKRLSVLLVAALGLPACSTITTGTSQSVSVVTDPPGAACQLLRGGELIGVVSPTPGTVQVDKSMRGISVECARPGYQGAVARVPARLQPMFLGNVLIGGVIGMVVDIASGAGSRYPSTATVAMRRAEPDSPPGGTPGPELPPIASNAPHARYASGALPAGGLVRLASASAPGGAVRRKLLVRVDYPPASGPGSSDSSAGRGLVILEVLPGGVGSSAGLRPGDVILALDGIPVAGVEDMRHRLGAVGADGTVVATVRRDGQVGPTPLHF